MRILNGALALLLLAFAVVQYNDPDGVLWMAAYGLGVLWTLMAALVPRVLALKPISMMLSFTVAAMLLGVIYFWPDTPGWWRTEVWWETETVREAMGLMVMALALLAPVATSIHVGNARRRAEKLAREQALEARHRSAMARRGMLDA